MVCLMPCVLRITSRKSWIPFAMISLVLCVAALMIRYKCGFVPLGIFPALIACLIAKQYFMLVEKEMIKIQKVQFHCGLWQFLVSLLCYPKFYTIVISKLPVVGLTMFMKNVRLSEKKLQLN